MTLLLMIDVLLEMLAYVSNVTDITYLHISYCSFKYSALVITLTLLTEISRLTSFASAVLIPARFEFLRIDPPESELRLADFFVVSWFTAGNGTQLPMKPIYTISRSLLFELCIVRTLVIRLIVAVQTIIYLWHSILAFNFRPIRDLQKKSTKFKFRTRKKVHILTFPWQNHHIFWHQF